MKRLFGLALAALSALPVTAHAATLLSIDLSVENQLTINAEPGLASASVGGRDLTGIYLSNFYAGAGLFPTSSLISGNFTTANNPSNNNPLLWRASANDLGLNIYEFSTDNRVSITAGQQAFTGSATWSISNAIYTDMLAGGGTFGSIYFAADSADDLRRATLIGEFSVTYAAPVPLPAPLFLLGAALFGWVAMSRRQRKRSGGAVLSTT